MKKEALLQEWANSLSKTDSIIEVNVLTIPKICNSDGTLKKSYCYNHGYYFHYKDDPICKAYNAVGFSFDSYDEITKILKLKRSMPQIEKENTEVPGAEFDESFQKVDISFLDGKNFYIPDYQRGYRWLDEARFFVRDINENALPEYLFQPLVVKKINHCDYKQKLQYGAKSLPTIESGSIADDELYELIDGQQRLTTLFLVLYLLKTNPGFSIYYENVREIDNLYMNLAKRIIEDELPKAGIGFEGKLRRTGRFIWYNDNTGRKPEDVFKSLNADKTELTSSELFKALLLHSGNNAETNIEINSLISYQLDAMESELNNEDLWRFVSDNQAPANRVQLIFDIFAYMVNKLIIKCKRNAAIEPYKNIALALNTRKIIDSKYAFLSFDNFISALNDNATVNYQDLKGYRKYVRDSQAFWEEIYDIFEMIKSWHSDPCMHNLVGFLLARKGLSYFNRVKLIQELINEQCQNKYDDFKGLVLKRIKESVLTVNEKKVVISSDPANFQDDTVSFSGKQKNRCYDILLLTNVWYAYKGNMPFNYKCLKDKYNVTKERKQLWDIEHINARTAKGELLSIRDPQKLDYEEDDGTKVRGDGKTYVYHSQTIISELENLQPMLSDPGESVTVSSLISKLSINSRVCPDLTLNKDVSNIWKKYMQGKEEDDSISNLTLLASDINRSYHNDPYNEKCLIIQKKDEQGWFIPNVTKNIFLSKKYTDKHLWNQGAQTKYREELISIIDEIWRMV